MSSSRKGWTPYWPSGWFGWNPASTREPRAGAGAIGLTQVLPSTARLYEPGLSVEQLYEPATNLRLGFRYLHDLMARYGTLNHALVAYNRGPGKLQDILDAGQEPKSAYARRVAGGYKAPRSGK